ncbi:MAG: GspH/FimT family pseudopilin [Deltaproteobacteria bacterium]|nr:GspH/FimT family pseudopilin [Deltaproteobacteria bacterium]
MRKGTTGFTVVEIMAVFAVIGIVSAISAPAASKIMARIRLNAAARRVMGDLMWARMQAVSEHNEFKVSAVSEYEYEILDDDDNDGKHDGREWAGVRDLTEDYSGVTIRFSSSPIFFPRGSATPGTITLANKSGSKQVKIHLTGRVKIL